MQNSSIAAICLSLVAIAISLVTMWLTLLRKGTIRMTRPTVVFFGPDGGDKKTSKVFFRTLLYSTSKRGQVIENLFVRLKRGESRQNFNIWIYQADKLYRGSGLFVGETGIATNHHFLLPIDTGSYEFKAGDYVIEVYALIVGESHKKLLCEISLSVSPEEALQLKQDKGIYFDWGPDSNKYHSHIYERPRSGGNLDTLFEDIFRQDKGV